MSPAAKYQRIRVRYSGQVEVLPGLYERRTTPTSGHWTLLIDLPELLIREWGPGPMRGTDLIRFSIDVRK